MSTTDETYNGWTNRETWAVALWINNDQGLQESVYDVVRGIDTSDPYGAADYDAHDRTRLLGNRAGDAVKEWLEELFDLDTHDGMLPREVYLMVQDIGSLWRVDWDEIGASFLRDASEQDA